MGIVLAIYLWVNRKTNSGKKDQNGLYIISIFQETIRSLQSLKLPKYINRQTTEEYYLELSHICRNYIKEIYFITHPTKDRVNELCEKFLPSFGSRDRIDFNTDISNEVNGGYCKGTIVFIIFIDQEIFYSNVAIFVPR